MIRIITSRPENFLCLIQSCYPTIKKNCGPIQSCWLQSWSSPVRAHLCWLDSVVDCRGDWSHFFRLRPCSKIFESTSGSFSKLRIRLLFWLLLLPKLKTDSRCGSGFSKNLDSGCGSGSEEKTQNPADATSGGQLQRWEGFNIFPSGSSREFLKLSPSPTIVQKVQDI